MIDVLQVLMPQINMTTLQNDQIMFTCVQGALIIMQLVKIILAELAVVLLAQL